MASRRDGTRIIDSDWGEGQGRPWYSHDGRYMCGIDVEAKKGTVWLLDTSSGRILTRKRIKLIDEYNAQWRRGAFTVFEYMAKEKPLVVLRP